MTPGVHGTLCIVSVVATLGVTTAFAQEDPAVKATPSSHTIVMPETARPAGQDTARPPAPVLPKIDLPEYVITGTTTIDLPETEKEPEPGETFFLGPALPPPGRERMIVPNPAPPVQPGGWRVDAMEGRVAASLGTYFTPFLSLWLGSHDETLAADGSVAYHRTKGWSAHTDESGFGFHMGGSVNGTGSSPFLSGGRLSGELAYDTRSYHLYGSSMAANDRTFDRFQFDATAQNLSNPDVPIAISLGFGNGGVKDSSLRMSESDVSFGVNSWFNGAGLDLEAGFRYDHGSLSGTSESTLSRFELTIATVWKGQGFTIRGSLRGGAVEGGGGRLSRLYPNLTAAIPVAPAHTIDLGFEPRLGYRTLLEEIAEMPYLSGQTTIRQSDLRQRWSGALRSDWSNLLSTRLSIAVENVGNRAYLSDTAASGVWTLAYSGDATVVTLTGEVVAKLTANDYFVSGLLVRSAHHSDIGSEVPYEPEVEAGLVYRRRLGEAVTLSPSILVSSRRIASPSGIPKLPAIVRADLHAEWTRWNDVRLTLDLTNVTDQRIERWNGYRERPLTVTAGMELCW